MLYVYPLGYTRCSINIPYVDSNRLNLRYHFRNSKPRSCDKRCGIRYDAAYIGDLRALMVLSRRFFAVQGRNNVPLAGLLAPTIPYV